MKRIMQVILCIALLSNCFYINGKTEAKSSVSQKQVIKSQEIANNVKNIRKEKGINVELKNLENKETVIRKDLNIGDKSKININGYQNQEKISKKVGQKYIEISNQKDIKQNKNNELIGKYLITKDNKIKEINNQTINNEYENKSTDNLIEVIDGKIVKIDRGIVTTIGGYNTTKYMYQSLVDASKEINGVSISGGEFEGSYAKTIKYQGIDFIKIKISGFEGFMKLEDVQLIPSNLIMSESYYQNDNGIWNYYEAVSPLTSNEYLVYPMDSAPSFAKEGIKYYSNDDSHFSTNNIILENENLKSSESYFQNLPLRSTSNYSAKQYQNYLKNLGKTNSKYYKSTSAFVEAQDKEFVNSLFLYAMANHEGAYGTSNFSNKCNNFFGRGAYDSDPNNACKEYGFSSARDGILAQAIFLRQNYLDVDWFGYHGGELGNKSHGMNVSYATDPNWGKNISSMMYKIDSALKGKENNKYRIYQITKSESLKKKSNLKDDAKKKAQGKGEESYKITRNNGKNPRVVVTSETSKAIQVQLPMGMNLSGSGYVKWSDAKKGKYANYEGTFGGKGNYDNYVNGGVANFANKYKSWSSQRLWYSKGSAKFVVGNKKPVGPGVLSNGNDSECTILDRETTNGSGVYTKRESEDGLKVCENKTSSENKNIYYKENVYYTNGIQYKDYQRNYQNGENLNTFDKRYYVDKKLSAYFEQRYNGNIKYKDYQRTYYTNGNFKETKQNDNNRQTGKQKDYKETTYDSNFRVTKEYIRSCFENGVKKMTQDKRYNNSKFTHYYEYRYNDKNKILKRYIRDYQNGKFYLTKENDNDANGVIKEYKETNYQSGKRMREYTRIYKNGKAYYYIEKKYNSKGNLISNKKYYY